VVDLFEFEKGQKSLIDFVRARRGLGWRKSFYSWKTKLSHPSQPQTQSILPLFHFPKNVIKLTTFVFIAAYFVVSSFRPFKYVESFDTL
jgi:hypothetical protein